VPKAQIVILEKTSNEPRALPRKRVITITAESVTIGSDSHADIQLKTFSSPFTLEIKSDGRFWWLLNPMRRSGVVINERPLSLDQRLEHLDAISIEGHRLTFELAEELLARPFKFLDQPKTDEALWDYFMTEDQFDEILINGSSTIYVDYRGTLHRTPWSFSDDDFLIKKISEKLPSARGGWASWRHDRRLRFQGALPPIVEKPHLAIRKTKKFSLGFNDLAKSGFGTPEQMTFIHEAIRTHQNIIVSGGTSTGKTSFLKSLIELMDPQERIVVLEEEAEIEWSHPHLVSIECGKGGLKQSIVESLRMRPNRLIVSEVRGVEAFEMLQAMNTGHSGCLTTIHANSTREVISRVEALVLSSGNGLPLGAVRRHIAQAIHLIIHLGRSTDGRRFIESISRISGIQNETILFGDPLQTEPLGLKQKVLRSD